jgi:DhnA family fructose-bisphosphate aldolase class Ia
MKGISTIEELNKWIAFAVHNGIPGVVLNAGIIDKLDLFEHPEIVLQCMGLPNKVKGSLNKVQTATIESAIALDACAVSVQLMLGASDLQNAIQSISNIVSQANKNHLPVLFMVNESDWNTGEDLNYAIRICAELGADLIKVALPSKREVQLQVQTISPKHPPVLLAGGGLSGSFMEQAKVAHELGFGGVCIGRNLFQSDSPAFVINAIDEIFGDHR